MTATMHFILEPSDYPAVLPIFSSLDHHLATSAVLQGSAPGRVWADNARHPNSAFLTVGHRHYLAGEPGNPAFNRMLRDLFFAELMPQARARGEVEFLLFYPSAGWEAALGEILAGHEPNIGRRQAYETHSLRDPDWRGRIPEGLFIQPVDETLMAEEGLGNLEELRQETTSETPALEYFLQRRFGFCLRSPTELAGWCLSEYNCAGRCEIGIETVESFQRRGVAVLTGSALIEHALGHGIQRIGWDCWSNNLASARTALKLGFELIEEYPVAFAWNDLPANLAVHGHFCLQEGQFSEARAWFERACQAGSPPAWGRVEAAFACARLDDRPAALGQLRAALDQCFAGLDWIRGSEHLASLHATPEWKEWIEGEKSA